MMDDGLVETIYNNFKTKDTEELVTILNQHNTNEWSDEAFEAAKRILAERNIDIPEKKKISEKLIFNVPAKGNSGDKPAKTKMNVFLGRLVLTDKRLMFLSTGKKEGSWGEIFGSTFLSSIIGKGAEFVMKNLLESSPDEEINISDIYNDGSWELSIPDIVSCESVSSIFSGSRIRIVGKMEGNEITHWVYEGQIKSKTETLIILAINNMIKLI